MRSSFFQVLKTWTVALGITAIALAGCSSTSSYTMPGSNWLSWGKKKPANSTLASTNPPKTTHLPAPPSSVATPQPAPTYAQTAPTASPQGAAGSSAASTTWNTDSWNPNSPAATGRTPSPGGNVASSPHAAAPNTAQGFYSPQYNPASQPAPSPSQPSQWGATPHAPVGGYAANPAAGGYQPATAVGAGGYGTYGSPSSHPIGGQGGYSAPAPQGGYGDTGGAAARNTASIYGQPPPANSVELPDTYRPGSTARATPYGSSDSLYVAEAPGERPNPGSEADANTAPAGYLPGSSSPQYSPANSAQPYYYPPPQNYPSTYR